MTIRKLDQLEANMTKEIDKMLDGTLVDVSASFVVCQSCDQEIEEEAIIKEGKPYHYSCSGMQL